MKRLPYFRWFPDDVEEECEFLTDEEFGFHVRCLNKSWRIGGLPADEVELAKLMHCHLNHLRKVWPQVSKLWVLNSASNKVLDSASHNDSTSHNTYHNTYQDSQRIHAITKSISASKSAKISDKRTAITPDTQISDTDTSSKREVSSKGKEQPKREEAVVLVANGTANFSGWWAVWSAVRGTNHQINAEHAYYHHVTVAHLEAACLECTESYLAGLSDPARGYNPESFLIDQSREQFRARWPARKGPARQDFVEDSKAVIRRNLLEKGKPW